jgi:hypothetical protein
LASWLSPSRSSPTSSSFCFGTSVHPAAGAYTRRPLVQEGNPRWDSP